MTSVPVARRYLSLMLSPKEYIGARSSNVEEIVLDGFKYLPRFKVDPKSEESIKAAIVAFSENSAVENLTVSKVKGGLTKQLFKIEGLCGAVESDGTDSDRLLSEAKAVDGVFPDTILMRVFGAGDLIDRDIENATYAALSREGLAPAYYGRFANGRLEGYLNMRPIEVKETPVFRREIAAQLGNMHRTFCKMPNHLREYHSEPNVWKDIKCMDEGCVGSKICEDGITAQSETLHLEVLPEALEWLQNCLVPPDAEVAFCHNDVHTANILVTEDDASEASAPASTQLVDFEYSSVNFVAFDIANHFNEYAGGNDTGIPDYSLLPTTEQKTEDVLSRGAEWREAIK